MQINVRKIELTAESLYAELSTKLGGDLITVGFTDAPKRLYVHTRTKTTLIPARYKGVIVREVVSGRVKPAATA